jgi:hypothetical protein
MCACMWASEAGVAREANRIASHAICSWWPHLAWLRLPCLAAPSMRMGQVPSRRLHLSLHHRHHSSSPACHWVNYKDPSFTNRTVLREENTSAKSKQFTCFLHHLWLCWTRWDSELVTLESDTGVTNCSWQSPEPDGVWNVMWRACLGGGIHWRIVFMFAGSQVGPIMAAVPSVTWEGSESQGGRVIGVRGRGGSCYLLRDRTTKTW